MLLIWFWRRSRRDNHKIKFRNTSHNKWMMLLLSLSLSSYFQFELYKVTISVKVMIKHVTLQYKMRIITQRRTFSSKLANHTLQDDRSFCKMWQIIMTLASSGRRCSPPRSGRAVGFEGAPIFTSPPGLILLGLPAERGRINQGGMV
jgi:hypothetical protein